MPRQNRVTPHGELIAVADRGMFWGNRGGLHDPAGRLVRYSRGRAWAICVLEFKGRRRQQWAPNRLTELFFLDEATGLAAGHRPCGECRYRDYQAFKRAWAAAHGGGVPGVAEIDARLHADRLLPVGQRPAGRQPDGRQPDGRLAGAEVRRTYTAELAGLPDGTMIEADGAPFLVHGGGLLAWTPGGYVSSRAAVPPPGLAVTVITPRATVAVLAAGYRPLIHPSAAAD